MRSLFTRLFGSSRAGRTPLSCYLRENGPIAYELALFDKEAVYGAFAPKTIPFPAVNEEALKNLDLVSKTAAGPADGPIKITERDFGWAAARACRFARLPGS